MNNANEEKTTNTPIVHVDKCVHEEYVAECSICGTSNCHNSLCDGLNRQCDEWMRHSSK